MEPHTMNKSLTEHVQSLRERLAEIEHEQWIAWSKDIAKTEGISEERFIRWQKLWRPYNELTEVEKDQDREWGDKAFLSQLKTIELVKEELIDKGKDVINQKDQSGEALSMSHGFNEGIATAITLLDTIIQDIKIQIK